MLSIGMHKDQVKKSVEHNVIYILTMTPQDEILTKGTPCVQKNTFSMDSSAENKKKWNDFWKYFKICWLSSPFLISTWNIHSKDDEERELHDRTNNGLEKQVTLIAKKNEFSNFLKLIGTIGN